MNSAMPAIADDKDGDRHSRLETRSPSLIRTVRSGGQGDSAGHVEITFRR
jgi:hypothetical protein